VGLNVFPRAAASKTASILVSAFTTRSSIERTGARGEEAEPGATDVGIADGAGRGSSRPSSTDANDGARARVGLDEGGGAGGPAPRESTRMPYSRLPAAEVAQESSKYL
jgi:hypothetical protein